MKSGILPIVRRSDILLHLVVYQVYVTNNPINFSEALLRGQTASYNLTILQDGIVNCFDSVQSSICMDKGP